MSDTDLPPLDLRQPLDDAALDEIERRAVSHWEARTPALLRLVAEVRGLRARAAHLAQQKPEAANET